MNCFSGSSITGRVDSTVDRLFAPLPLRRQLDNGLIVLHQPEFRQNVVSVQIWVKTGSIHEGSLTGSGLSHYLEHMLFKGTERRDAAQISRQVHALGGSMNAYTTFDRTVYYIDAPSSAFHQVVEILSDMLFASKLAVDETEMERDVILREIDMGLDDPDRILSQALFRNAYRKHPYREPVIGHRALFEKVSRDELVAYYRSRYVPNNCVVCVAGAVNSKECFEGIEKYLGTLPMGRLSPVSLNAEPVQLASRNELIEGDYNVMRGGMAFKVPHLSHPDSGALDSLASILGGGESSILWDHLRNRQNLVHYIDCRNWNPGESGLFWISYVCEPGKQEAVQSAVFKLINQIAARGVEQAELDKAYNQALSAEINSRRTMSGLASKLGFGEVVVGEINYGKHYLERLHAVCPEDIARVSANYLTEASLTTVAAGPVASFGSADLETSTVRPNNKTPECINLPSGAKLVLQPDPSLPKVHLRAVLLGGAHYEAADQRGISALLAQMLTKDTGRHSAAEVAHLLEKLGGSFSATTGNNSIHLAIEVFPHDLSVAIQLLSDALLQPVFNEGTFRTELESQIAGLKESDDEIFDYGFRILRERFFGQHPFSIGAEGRVGDLEKLDIDVLRKQAKRLVCGANLVLSVCGDFDQQHLIKAITDQLDSVLPKEPFSRAEVRPHVPAGPAESIEYMDREQALVLLGFPDVGLCHEQFIVGEVINELCSGMSSRLFQQIREEKGLAYYVSSMRLLGLHEAMFVFYAGTHPQAVETVIQEMRGEIARITEGKVSDEELSRCRNRLKAARLMNRQTIRSRAMQAGMNLAYGLPLESDEEYAEKLEKVDSRAIADFAGQYFASDKGQQLIVMPRE